MTAGDAKTVQAGAVIKRLADLQRLTLDAVQAGSLEELLFLMVNRTAAIVPYDRATLWRLSGEPGLLAVSGGQAVQPDAPGVRARRAWLADLEEPGQAGIWDGDFPDEQASPGGLLWLPIEVHGEVYGGLLLERFSPARWSETEKNQVAPVAAAYSAAWRVFAREDSLWRRPQYRRKGLAALAVCLLLIICFVRVPLRIVAPCEIIPSRPTPVNAPQDGILREILVRPGQDVAVGDLLYVFDGDVAREELELSRRQVELAQENLQRTAALAMSDRAYRAEAQMIANRLEQERVRLEAATLRVGKLSVSAPVAGTVIMGDPAEFLGRPVSTGEAVLVLADQDDTRLRIWLPQDDRIDFRADRDIRVFLHADAGRSRRADLTYVAAHAQLGMDGIYGFMAEAVWKDDSAAAGAGAPKLGLKGTAVLYGDDVSLGYWLVRKPLAVLRRFFGI